MIQPPALPVSQRRSPIRIGLGVMATSAILSGQFVTAGALYGYSFMGIAFGVIAVLKETFHSGGGYVLMLVGVLLIITLMFLLFAGLLLGLVLAIYIAVSCSPSVVISRFVSFLFGGLAFSIFSGLELSRWLSTRPDFHVEVHIESHYFLWPAFFAVLAILYATLPYNNRNA